MRPRRARAMLPQSLRKSSAFPCTPRAGRRGHRPGWIAPDGAGGSGAKAGDGFLRSAWGSIETRGAGQSRRVVRDAWRVARARGRGRVKMGHRKESAPPFAGGAFHRPWVSRRDLARDAQIIIHSACSSADSTKSWGSLMSSGGPRCLRGIAFCKPRRSRPRMNCRPVAIETARPDRRENGLAGMHRDDRPARGQIDLKSR